MNSTDDHIGKSIINLNSAIGEIVDVTALHQGGDEFFKVAFPDAKCINYFSLKNNKDYRVVADEKTMKKAIKIFKKSFDTVEYDSVQEKINTQKELLLENDICKLAKTLSIMNAEKDLHAQLSKSFNTALDTLVTEAKFVLDATTADIYSMLALELPKKKKQK
jgi:RNA polymerase-interacting CarD/CdnL/TRCF family regulator